MGRQRGTAKKAKAKRDTDRVGDEVVQEILPDGPKVFPDDFWEPSVQTGRFVEVAIPEEPLKLGGYLIGQQDVVTEGGFRYRAKNPAEAKYLIYAQRSGVTAVRVPEQPIAIFKTVKNYEMYVREVKRRLLEAYTNRTLDHRMAARLTQAALQRLGLPEVGES